MTAGDSTSETAMQATAATMADALAEPLAGRDNPLSQAHSPVSGSLGTSRVVCAVHQA
jgi:hypothetical protein